MKSHRRLTILAGLACVVVLGLGLWHSGGDSDGLGPSPPTAERTSPPDPPPELDSPAAGAAPRVVEELAAPDVEIREHAVVVLGPMDIPLAGVRVRGFWKPGKWVETDGVGRVSITFPQKAQDTTVRLSGPVPEITALLTGPETVVRFPDLIPLSVQLVDGETGDRVGGGAVHLRAVHGPPLLLVTYGARHELPVAPVRPGRSVALCFEVDPPPGYAGPADEWFRVKGSLSAFARQVEVTIPLYPEAVLIARVEEHYGEPAAGAVVQRVRIGGKIHSFSAEPVGANGRTRIRGIPALRGESVDVTAAKHRRRGTSSGVRLGPPSMPVEALVKLPETAPRRRLIAGGGARSTSRLGFAFGMRKGAGSLEVRVLHLDGAPAVGARVRFVLDSEGATPSVRTLRTDDSGRAVCTGLPDTRATVDVTEPGFRAPLPETIEVQDGVKHRVEIRETRGASVTVTVRDADGRPVPFARLTVTGRGGVAYARLEGDRQILTLFTDATGRLVLDDLPVGVLRVIAEFGSRKAEGATSDGGPVTIRLPR